MSKQLKSLKLNNIDIEAIKQNLFTLAYVVFLAEIILSYSLYGYMDVLQPVFSVVRKITFAVIFVKLLLDLYTHEFSLREMLLIAFVGCLLLVSAFKTGERVLLAYWAFIVAGRNADYRRIIGLSLAVHIVCLIVVVASTYVGILDNIIYYRSEWNQTGPRESLGFHYASEIAHMFFYTTLMWIYYRKDKIHPVEWLIIAMCTIYIYIKTDTKNPMVIGLFAVICSVMLKYFKSLRKYYSWYTLIAICIVPALMCFIIWASYNYSPDNKFLDELNKLVSGRIHLGQIGLGYCDIRPFGQHIVWGTQSDGTYFFIDSSYMLILFNYGVVILVMLAAASMALGRRIGQKKDIWMLLCFALIAVHSTFDAFILNLGYNSFIMLYSYFKET